MRYWARGAPPPSFCGRASRIPPPTSFPWTWDAGMPTPWLRPSWKVRTTNDFPGTSFDPAGLRPSARALHSGPAPEPGPSAMRQSLRLGVWASFTALFPGVSWGEFGPQFPGNREIPGKIGRRDGPNSDFTLGFSDPRRSFPSEDRGGVRFGSGGLTRMRRNRKVRNLVGSE